ncbi:MAG: hypothetical protein J7493_09440 [Porphyrobacter sp.]|nr:hypothetical protein [Porphyrobacter sp.]
MQKTLALLASLAVLSACSPQTEPTPDASDATPATASQATAGTPVVSASPAASARTLTLEGLGDLRIGQPVPAGSTWAESEGQASDTCRTINSPDYPGVYAIVEEGKVRRITVGQRSDVKLAEGIGVGATEKEAISWFPFPATPHVYEEAPAKYLTAPNARSGDPALRLEIGQDGRVSLIHVGTAPTLEYVEGCA